MGGPVRQKGWVPLRQPPLPRRAPVATSARVPAGRDPFAPAARANGRMASELPASSTMPMPLPAAAGNGMRVLLMPPETITARAPDKVGAEAGAAPVVQADGVAQDAAAKPAAQPDDKASAPVGKQAADAQAAPQEGADAQAPGEASDVIELDAPAEPRPAATVAVRRGGWGDGSSDPRVIVQRWRGGVASAGAGLPRPGIAAATYGPSRIAAAADTANAKRSAQTQKVPAEAAAKATPTPPVPDPPPPPRSNPIASYTAAIEALSKERLPDADLPLLVTSAKREVVPGVEVGGNLPRLDERAVPNHLFQILMTEGADKVARIPEQADNPERAALESARAKLAKPLRDELDKRKEGEGKPAPLQDKGPVPFKPLEPGLGTPVAEVVARLLASLDKSTTDVLARLRVMAYPLGILADRFPDIGPSIAGIVAPRMSTELRDIAGAAGIGGAELDSMVERRRTGLDKQAAEAQQAIAKSNETAAGSVSKTGQGALDAIEGARQLTDEELVKRQEAATGGSDPAVINAHRDLVLRWVRNRVTTATTDYQKAGEKRDAELNDAQGKRVEAYNALAQREEYEGLNPLPPKPPHDRGKPAIARRLADFAAALRADTRATIEALKTAMRPLFATARDRTRDNRAAVEKAGNEAIDAANTWAEERVLEGKSWWERFKATLGSWFSDSRKANEQWSVRRSEETRDQIALDLASVGKIQEDARNGATKEQLLGAAQLDEGKRAVIDEFFAQGKDADPLDIAAGALRQQLAREYLPAAKPVFESELLAQPKEKLEDAAEVARFARPSFSATKIVLDIHAQLDNLDSDESAILRSLEGLSSFEGALVRRLYIGQFGIELDWAMQKAFDPDEMAQANLRLSGQGAEADAAALDYAFGTINTDEKAVMDLLRGRTPEEIERISAAYERRYGKTLDQALIDKLGKGNELDQARALKAGKKDVADSIAIDDAMRVGFFGWGNNYEEVDAVYKRVHAEVLAQAQAEGWSSDQMKAEVRRRTGLMEKDFNERYKHVEQYKVPGSTSVLRGAFASGILPGPERDLANALADSDMIKADAARIQLEHKGAWASDEAINKILANQYESALQDARLDRGPARTAVLVRRNAELRSKKPKLDEDEISLEIIKLEHELDLEDDKEAQRRSHISMGVLNDVFQQNYTYPLSHIIEIDTSGVAQKKARDLHSGDGRLTDVQLAKYAIHGSDEDKEALHARMRGMPKSEMDTLKRDWAAGRGGEDIRTALAENVDGRLGADILDLYDKGAPKSASERIAQERRRLDRELRLTGWLGGMAAGSEADWLRQQVVRLDELEPKLFRRDLPDDQRQLLNQQLDYRIELVQQAAEDHRRAIDSVANFAAQVASLVVAVTVGALLTAVSGGTLGPVMAAAIASVAATITSMGTKALVKGPSYSTSEINVDLVVGVVDVFTSIATAGMGGKILRGASGVAPQVVRGAAKPASNRLLVGIEKLAATKAMQAAAKTRAAQTAGKVFSTLNQMESGFLTRGIKGTNVLARMAQGDNKALRILAEGLAEGIENAVSALPSSFAGTALNDKTWEGNPLLNLAAGTYEGVKGAVQLGAVMHGVRGVHGAMSSHIRLSTPEGRLTEANRILNDARDQHRAKNPNSTHREFLTSPEAHRAQAEIEQRGLIGEQRKLAMAGGSGAPKAEPAARPDAAPKAEPKPEGGLHPEAKAERAERAEAEAKANERAPSTKEAALGAKDAAPSAHPDKAVDPATQALRDGLPKSFTDRVDVRVDEKLEGNSVHIIPDPRGPGHGVRVEVGPHATPTDVLLHAHTIQTMRRYQGLLGKLRQFKDWFNLTTVGTRGWEARLELEKLPGIIHERMQRLSEGGLTPEAHQKLVDEINHLSKQIDAHQKVLNTPELREEPGRGFVAAEGEGKRRTVEPIEPPGPEGQRKRGSERGTGLEKTSDPEIVGEHARSLQILDEVRSLEQSKVGAEDILYTDDSVNKAYNEVRQRGDKYVEALQAIKGELPRSLATRIGKLELSANIETLSQIHGELLASPEFRRILERGTPVRQVQRLESIGGSLEAIAAREQRLAPHRELKALVDARVAALNQDFQALGGKVTKTGVALHPKLPAPEAGYGFYPEARTPEALKAHLAGYVAELRLANHVAESGAIVVQYGHEPGINFADIVSVDPVTGRVTLWDSKFRDAGGSGHSDTFQGTPLEKSIENAKKFLNGDKHGLPHELVVKARQSLEDGNFDAVTSHTSGGEFTHYRKTFKNGNVTHQD